MLITDIMTTSRLTLIYNDNFHANDCLASFSDSDGTFEKIKNLFCNDYIYKMDDRASHFLTISLLVCPTVKYTERNQTMVLFLLHEC